MAKTIFDDTPPLGTVVTAAFLNALNNHRHTGRDNDGEGALNYAASTGSANAYAATLSPALDAHIIGMPIIFKATHTNTGAATININSLGAVAIKRLDGEALQADDILSGQMVTVAYDGTYYQMINNSRQEIDLDDFAASLVTNGYQKLPGGMILQWGTDTTAIGETSRSISFPMEFPTAVLNVSLTARNPSESATIDSWPQLISATVSGFSYYSGRVGTGNNAGITWIAIGY